MIPPSYGIGTAVQDVGAGHPAGEVPVDVDVVRIQDIFDPHHRGYRQAAFIDAAADCYVGVAIDDAGHRILTGRVDDRGARGDRNLGADLRDLAVADDDGAPGDVSMRDGKDRGVFYDCRSRSGGFSLLVERRYRGDAADCDRC